MQRRVLLIVALALILVAAIGFFLRGRLVPAQAGLLIETSPQAQVFLDEDLVGVTPVEVNRQPGEVVIKLVPVADDGPLAPYETKVTLTGGIRTVVRRNFAATDEKSSGELISFERIGGRVTSLAVVSSPDSAEIFLDGVSQGFAPVRVDSVSVGKHTVIARAEGYSEHTVEMQAAQGFKLTLLVKLASTEEVVQPEEELQVLVEILETPTGFLRVREEPTTSATESGRVTPGQEYLFVEENEDKTWYKIEYEEGKTGWVSAQYAEKVEQKGQD